MDRPANEEIVLHLINAKCLAVLLYMIEECLVIASPVSLEFTVKRRPTMIKLFRTYVR